MGKTFKESGLAAIPSSEGTNNFRFTVSAEHEKLHMLLEDKSTKAHWQTEQLSLADFLTSENAIPQASVVMYAEWFAESLARPDLLVGSTRLISDGLEDGSHRLLINLPLQTLATTTSLEYSFRLTIVQFEGTDVLDARMNDVEASTKAVADEVATLRRENAELTKRLDVMTIDHGHQVRLMQEEAAQHQKSHNASSLSGIKIHHHPFRRPFRHTTPFRMAASKQSGAVSFHVDGASRPFRFTVSTTYDKLRVWLEDTTTKQQWQTKELTKEEFTTSETALPQATAEDYAMRIVECLTPDVSHTDTSRSLSGPLGDGTLVLRVGFALQALKFSTPLEYKFTLTSVKVSTVDVINARLKDIDEAAKAAVDEVAKLRFENEKLEDRLDKFKYEHRLMKEELVQFKQQQQCEITKVLEKSMQQLKLENRALTEEMVGAGHKRKRFDV